MLVTLTDSTTQFYVCSRLIDGVTPLPCFPARASPQYIDPNSYWRGTCPKRTVTTINHTSETDNGLTEISSQCEEPMS
jgi:hypothetical protein